MTCPICGSETRHAYRPFCSRRCADRDLGNWLKGSYAIPPGEHQDPDDAPEGFETGRPRPH
ncbi:DNA gyrase inhibitor YacG [Sedimentitalea sp. JM2-8]|uniref:DNA gyrase inhibitor YacG n=1 Tax=Sedimentitalea xiamensis TaxID=3050037 RepID=A0ABT7FLA9_9RHOB|nr:DNA gyrase inhibitor YacG [Sedimentitalea xiamensis]MDK3075795.1 DNA gyrase inhibitor YacG [Sedimentitalea xiamensis]